MIKGIYKAEVTIELHTERKDWIENFEKVKSYMDSGEFTKQLKEYMEDEIMEKDGTVSIEQKYAEVWQDE